MEHTGEVATPVDTIRRRVKELRGRSGMTAADLASQLSALGVPWNRSIVANFEGGRRTTVSVVEWLALAQVFNVAPLHLIVPPHEPEDLQYQVTPAGTATIREVRGWVCGHWPLGGGNVAQFHREAPTPTWGTFERFGVDLGTPSGVRELLALARAVADSPLGKEAEGGDDGEHR